MSTIIGLTILLVLQLADMLTTYFGIRIGKGFEANKFQARLFEKIGVIPGLLLVKGIFVLFLFWAFPLMPIEAYWVINFVYAFVVINNLRIIYK